MLAGPDRRAACAARDARANEATTIPSDCAKRLRDRPVCVISRAPPQHGELRVPPDPRSFRSTYSSGVSGAVSTTCGSPFTVIRCDIPHPQIADDPPDVPKSTFSPANCFRHSGEASAVGACHQYVKLERGVSPRERERSVRPGKAARAASTAWRNQAHASA
jgi:hypothetical protein